MAVTATEEDDESDGNDDVDTQGRRVQLSTKAKARPAQSSFLPRRLFDEKLQFWPKGPIIEKCDRGHPSLFLLSKVEEPKPNPPSLPRNARSFLGEGERQLSSGW